MRIAGENVHINDDIRVSGWRHAMPVSCVRDLLWELWESYNDASGSTIPALLPALPLSSCGTPPARQGFRTV